ncbi:MAG: class I SAM-dependent methyltransferase [Chitinophagaceae bacterium]|nr:class I SAM-dependent methyltransferase [Chitinophagaceae bacterium]
MRDPITNEYIVPEWETVNCPVCNSSRFREYEKFGSKMQYTYVECLDCSLVYSSPRPKYDQDFIDSCYATYQFFEGAGLDDLDNIHTSAKSMFEKEIKNLVKFDKIRSNVLDIGCGMGTFLYAAKPYYKNLTGLDVSEKMANFVRTKIGVNVLLEQFQDHESTEPYSLIHMSHVIEHIPNPNAWMQHARKLLHPKGILVINVPNKMSLSRRLKHLYYKLGIIKQHSSSWKDPTRTPDHLYEPTIKSFMKLIDQNGFRVLDYFTYSRKDPVSDRDVITRFINRTLKIGTNLSFIVTPK